MPSLLKKISKKISKPIKNIVKHIPGIKQAKQKVVAETKKIAEVVVDHIAEHTIEVAKKLASKILTSSSKKLLGLPDKNSNQDFCLNKFKLEKNISYLPRMSEQQIKIELPLGISIEKSFSSSNNQSLRLTG
jgi:hypothetical protein